MTIRVELDSGRSRGLALGRRLSTSPSGRSSCSARRSGSPLISDLQAPASRHTLRTNLKVCIKHAGKHPLPEDLPGGSPGDRRVAGRRARPATCSPVLRSAPRPRRSRRSIDAVRGHLRTLLDTAERGFTGYQGSPDAWASPGCRSPGPGSSSTPRPGPLWSDPVAGPPDPLREPAADGHAGVAEDPHTLGRDLAAPTGLALTWPSSWRRAWSTWTSTRCYSC